MGDLEGAEFTERMKEATEELLRRLQDPEAQTRRLVYVGEIRDEIRALALDIELARYEFSIHYMFTLFTG